MYFKFLWAQYATPLQKNLKENQKRTAGNGNFPCQSWEYPTAYSKGEGGGGV